jgi:hypothetical protein
MNNKIARREPRGERIDRFQSLQSGQYWRALEAIPAECISENEVLLIQSIRYVDNGVHTVILRTHPDKYDHYQTVQTMDEDEEVHEKRRRLKEHRFLLKDFLVLFEFEPGFRRIRTSEMKQVQNRIDGLQKEMVEAQSNPRILQEVVEEELLRQEEKERKKEEEEQRAAEEEGDLREGKEKPEASTATLPARIMSPDELASIATGTVTNALESGINHEEIVS